MELKNIWLQRFLYIFSKGKNGVLTIPEMEELMYKKCDLNKQKHGEIITTMKSYAAFHDIAIRKTSTIADYDQEVQNYHKEHPDHFEDVEKMPEIRMVYQYFLDQYRYKAATMDDIMKNIREIY